MAVVHHIFGIRHHGPGSARSLLRALEQLQPDCLLVEGPPDADSLIPLIADAGMKPPVALLVYSASDAQQAVFYPFAAFSPEWQSIRFALDRGIVVRFCDLPQSQQMPLRQSEPEAEVMAPPSSLADAVRQDPLGALASAAGYSDGERWWEHVVESRADAQDVFKCVNEAMAELRATQGLEHNRRDQLREAFMRQSIRAAMKDGFSRIAVVCGAWHGPALAELPPAKEDAAALKGLEKTKVLCTWVPWSYSRLTFASGYGAGVASPGYYEHLWKHPTRTTVRWMTQAARLLRDEDIDCSSAHIIEAVRLAETLSLMRQLALPTLTELNEAARSVFCFDSDLPMQLIHGRLVVGERMGDVPETAPTVPLQQDLQREQKRLRLPPQELEKVLDLDLRNDTDRDRSRMLHRLNLLEIPWGVLQPGGGGKGTFHELWKLRWEVEFAVRIVEKAIWGNTLESASAGYARAAAAKAPDLPSLCALVNAVLYADLPDAVQELMQRLENQAAVAADLNHLMGALPPLAAIIRYGNVRGTDTTMVEHVVASLVSRICIGLPAACASLDDDAAAEMLTQIMAVHAAVPLLNNEAHTAAWNSALTRLADTNTLHGLIAGRCVRLLLDAQAMNAEAAATALSLALSTADPAYAAAWIEGFLHGSAIILLHDDALWRLLNEWVAQLADDAFTQLLPVLRRTFATFPGPERRQIGARARAGGSSPGAAAGTSADLDQARVAMVLPVLATILGTTTESEAKP